jgi:hypothetical protein
VRWRVWIITTALVGIGRLVARDRRTVSLAQKLTRGLSFKCWLLGHEDWIRFGPDKLYLECIECGRETAGWRVAEAGRVHTIAA